QPPSIALLRADKPHHRRAVAGDGIAGDALLRGQLLHLGSGFAFKARTAVQQQFLHGKPQGKIGRYFNAAGAAVPAALVAGMVLGVGGAVDGRITRKPRGVLRTPIAARWRLLQFAGRQLLQKGNLAANLEAWKISTQPAGCTHPIGGATWRRPLAATTTYIIQHWAPTVCGPASLCRRATSPRIKRRERSQHNPPAAPTL